MGKYIILGKPIAELYAPPNYRGLYRSEAYAYDAIKKNDEMMQLFLKYIANYADALGVNLQDFSMEELKKLTLFHQQHVDPHFEIVYFDSTVSIDDNMEFLGIDVAGVGGYSIIGGGFWANNKGPDNNDWHYFLTVFNNYFRSKLNDDGLLNSLEDAQCLLGVIREWDLHSPVPFENEEWQMYFLYKVSI